MRRPGTSPLTMGGVAFVLSILAFPAAAATILWDEASHGDLSDDLHSPTALALAVGENVLSASFGGDDKDYFSVLVPEGHGLTALRLGSATVTGSQFSFVAVQRGPTMSGALNAPAGLLGWTHFTNQQAGTDLLSRMGRGLGAEGFDAPLAPGMYSFWVQELEVGDDYRYQFSFEVRPVPLPGSLLLMGSALGALLAGRRRRDAAAVN